MSRPHDSAHLHVSGRSEYVDDRPELAGEVFVEVVFSTEAHAGIKKIEMRAALDCEGVLGVFTAADFADNMWGTIFRDQPLLAVDEVRFCGEAIALVAARSRETAREARDLVKVSYAPRIPILTIEMAKQSK